MALEINRIKEILVAKFSYNVSEILEDKGVVSIEVALPIFIEVVEELKNNEILDFHFLTDICGIHLPDNEIEYQFATVYHFHNMKENVRLRVKVFLHGEKPEIPTLVNYYASANWMERETFDFYGINFTGHPNLTRILNMDEMIVFPLRKEYPLEDAGRTDKDDRFFGRTIHNS